jgi:hypothetical protein
LFFLMFASSLFLFLHVLCIKLFFVVVNQSMRVERNKPDDRAVKF